MVKANANSIVRVTVTSKLAEFMDKPVIQKLVDKSVSWDSFLRKHEITVDPSIHVISALAGSVKALPQDKISVVVDKFKKRRSEYKATIVLAPNVTVAPTAPLRAQPRFGYRQQAETTDHRVRVSPRQRKPTKRFAQRMEEEEEDYEEEEGMGNNLRDEDEEELEEPIEVPASSIGDPEPQYGYGQPYRRQYAGSVFDRSDIGSQASRDTFDANIGEDIKGVVMAKLRDWATNGDLHRIREELRVVQANRKSLKVARYIPYTMNVLGVLFGNN